MQFISKGGGKKNHQQIPNSDEMLGEAFRDAEYSHLHLPQNAPEGKMGSRVDRRMEN